ncbi:MAG TPA: hypothetical protein VNJ03_14595 [Vicinamibacterales bacterium]|nr:hypothetical protein [Vicinamibacterales bacterium]
MLIRRRLIAALLFGWEPLRFAGEALSVMPTLADRGWTAVAELLAHALVAAFTAAAGLTLWHGAPDSTRLATAAISLSFARAAQSLYWTVLPTNTVPGDQFLILGTALLIAAAAITTLHVARSTST